MRSLPFPLISSLVANTNLASTQNTTSEKPATPGGPDVAALFDKSALVKPITEREGILTDNHLGIPAR